MNRERWQEIDRIFASVLELPASERASFLNEACNGDEELRKEAESLLAHDELESFMKVSASREAVRVLVEDVTKLIAGQTIGQYKILKQLGVGGMGEVLLAQDTRLNRPVALKLLSTHLTNDEERVHRFRQESASCVSIKPSEHTHHSRD